MDLRLSAGSKGRGGPAPRIRRGRLGRKTRRRGGGRGCEFDDGLRLGYLQDLIRFLRFPAYDRARGSRITVFRPSDARRDPSHRYRSCVRLALCDGREWDSELA